MTRGLNLIQHLTPLRNYGVGQKARRAFWKRYPEESYWEILQIKPKEDLKRGKVYGILTWRGVSDGKVRKINGPLKRDWQLVEESAK